MEMSLDQQCLSSEHSYLGKDMARILVGSLALFLLLCLLEVHVTSGSYRKSYLKKYHIVSSRVKIPRIRRVSLEDSSDSIFDDHPDYCIYLRIKNIPPGLDICLRIRQRSDMNLTFMSTDGSNLVEIPDNIRGAMVYGHANQDRLNSFVSGYIHNGQFFGEITFRGRIFAVEELWSHDETIRNSGGSPFPTLSNRKSVLYELVDFMTDSGQLTLRRQKLGDVMTDPGQVRLRRQKRSVSKKAERYRPYGRSYDLEDQSHLFKTNRIFHPLRQYEVVCRLAILADHFFFKNMANEDSLLAFLKLVSFAERVRYIFSHINYDPGNPNPGTRSDEIRYRIKDFVVFEKEDVEGYPITSSTLHLDIAERYVSTMSKGLNLQEFCIGIVISGHNFTGDPGKAFEPDPDRELGGLCESSISIDGETWSRNILAVSAAASGGTSALPSRKASTLIAYYMARAMGAKDDDSSCDPPDSEKNGYYLMHSHDQDGSKKNHWLLSQCSKMQIKVILDKQANCFTIGDTSYCGNGIIENGEECDCGTEHVTFGCEAHDGCCHLPMSKDACKVVTAKPCENDAWPCVMCNKTGWPKCQSHERPCDKGEVPCLPRSIYCLNQTNQPEPCWCLSDETPCCNETKLTMCKSRPCRFNEVPCKSRKPGLPCKMDEYPCIPCGKPKQPPCNQTLCNDNCNSSTDCRLCRPEEEPCRLLRGCGEYEMPCSYNCTGVENSVECRECEVGEEPCFPKRRNCAFYEVPCIECIVFDGIRECPFISEAMRCEEGKPQQNQKHCFRQCEEGEEPCLEIQNCFKLTNDSRPGTKLYDSCAECGTHGRPACTECKQPCKADQRNCLETVSCPSFVTRFRDFVPLWCLEVEPCIGSNRPCHPCGTEYFPACDKVRLPCKFFQPSCNLSIKCVPGQAPCCPHQAKDEHCLQQNYRRCNRSEATCLYETECTVGQEPCRECGGPYQMSCEYGRCKSECLCGSRSPYKSCREYENVQACLTVCEMHTELCNATCRERDPFMAEICQEDCQDNMDLCNYTCQHQLDLCDKVCKDCLEKCEFCKNNFCDAETLPCIRANCTKGQVPCTPCGGPEECRKVMNPCRGEGSCVDKARPCDEGDVPCRLDSCGPAANTCRQCETNETPCFFPTRTCTQDEIQCVPRHLPLTCDDRKCDDDETPCKAPVPCEYGEMPCQPCVDDNCTDLERPCKLGQLPCVKGRPCLAKELPCTPCGEYGQPKCYDVTKPCGLFEVPCRLPKVCGVDETPCEPPNCTDLPCLRWRWCELWERQCVQCGREGQPPCDLLSCKDTCKTDSCRQTCEMCHTCDADEVPCRPRLPCDSSECRRPDPDPACKFCERIVWRCRRGQKPCSEDPDCIEDGNPACKGAEPCNQASKPCAVPRACKEGETSCVLCGISGRPPCTNCSERICDIGEMPCSRPQMCTYDKPCVMCEKPGYENVPCSSVVPPNRPCMDSELPCVEQMICDHFEERPCVPCGWIGTPECESIQVPYRPCGMLEIPCRARCTPSELANQTILPWNYVEMMRPKRRTQYEKAAAHRAEGLRIGLVLIGMFVAFRRLLGQ